MRPNSLAEVAELTAHGESFDRCLAHFLDAFYAVPDVTSLRAVPRLLAPQSGELGRIQYAYLEATTEELARTRHFPVPAWTANDARALPHPWFASPLAALRAVLLLESPPAFRARNLFISENALWRA